MRTPLHSVAVVVIAAAAVAGQTSMDRQRAKPDYLTGWQLMRIEAWADAAKSFQKAIDIDQQYEDAYYGLGRAQMALKQFTGAIASYGRCRDLYRAESGRRFTNQQEAQRYRRDRLMEIDEVLRQYQQGPALQSTRVQERVRQLQEQRRQLQQILSRGANISIDSSVPAFVSLALGSAYFRAGNLADAEREYKATLAADARTGEAHSNLAVIYLETGRLADAERSIAAAEKAGLKVHPQLKRDVESRKKGT